MTLWGLLELCDVVGLPFPMLIPLLDLLHAGFDSLSWLIVPSKLKIGSKP